MKPEIYAIVTAVNELTRQMAVYEERIEKLEAALREMLIKCTWENTGRWCGSIDCHCRIARRALEGKDE